MYCTPSINMKLYADLSRDRLGSPNITKVPVHKIPFSSTTYIAVCESQLAYLDATNTRLFRRVSMTQT
jgi:hypothetical protein